MEKRRDSISKKKFLNEEEEDAMNSIKLVKNFNLKRDNIIDEYNQKLKEKNFMI